MPRYLSFQLYGPMAAWGDIAVGEARVSANHPSRSALIGLLAAGLGLTRDDESALAELSASVRFAVLVFHPGQFMRDYHTVQVPPATVMKKRPGWTRREELAVPKDDLGTILSYREYRADARYRVFVELVESGCWTLEALQNALERPVFPLYLGRKSCPPALPLAPFIVAGTDLFQVVRSHDSLRPGVSVAGELSLDLDDELPWQLFWEDGIVAGLAPLQSTLRRDQPSSRRRWQFDERIEHLALINPLEDAPCT